MTISTDINVLRSLVGPYNDLLSGSNSFYIPSPMPEVLSMAMQAGTRVDVTPRTLGNSYGQMFTFEINQQLPEIKRFNVNATISAITHNGTYCALTENFLQQLFALVEYKDPNYGSLQTYTPEVLISEYRLLPYTEQLHMANVYQLGLSLAQRSSMAASGFNATFPLPSWIMERPSQILRAQNLDSPMQIQLTVAPLATLLDTDATTVSGTLTLTMTFIGRIPTESERAQTASIINTPQGQMMQMRDYYYQEIQRIPAGTSGTIAIPIDVIKGPVRALDLFFRAYTNVHGGTGAYEYTQFLPSYKPYAFQIKTGNEYICQYITSDLVTRDEAAYLHNQSVPNQDLIRVDFADCPDKDLKINSGYLDFNYLGKPQIELIFTTPTAVDISFGILAKTTAFIQHARGTMRAISSN